MNTNYCITYIFYKYKFNNIILLMDIFELSDYYSAIRLAKIVDRPHGEGGGGQT
jgi:hypothetical protein